MHGFGLLLIYRCGGPGFLLGSLFGLERLLRPSELLAELVLSPFLLLGLEKRGEGKRGGCVPNSNPKSNRAAPQGCMWGSGCHVRSNGRIAMPSPVTLVRAHACVCMKERERERERGREGGRDAYHLGYVLECFLQAIVEFLKRRAPPF